MKQFVINEKKMADSYLQPYYVCLGPEYQVMALEILGLNKKEARGIIDLGFGGLDSERKTTFHLYQSNTLSVAQEQSLQMVATSNRK